MSARCSIEPQHRGGRGPCKLFFEEHTAAPCGDRDHQLWIAKRLEQAPEWDRIIRLDQGQDILTGEPIHCGDRLELQGVAYRSDDFGEYRVRLATGASVRYELTEQRRAILFTTVSGHEFSSRCELWMRFRWPVRR